METTKNNKLQVEEEMQKLANAVCLKYGVPSTPVTFSKTLIHFNGKYSYSAWTKSNPKIIISELVYTFFGEKECIDTLMHELAHHIRVVRDNDEEDHSEGFKKLCIELGGTMNSEQAGNIYMEHIGNNYVVDKMCVTYECQCGEKNHSKTTVTRKLDSYTLTHGICTACGNSVQNWKMSGNEKLIAKWNLNNPAPAVLPADWKERMNRTVYGYNNNGRHK